MDSKAMDENGDDVHRESTAVKLVPILTGTGRTMSAWERAFAQNTQASKHRISSWVRGSASVPDYDAWHRLVEGERYGTNLLFVRDIEGGSKRTTEEIIQEAIRKYGSESIFCARGEFAFLLRRHFSNQDLKEMNVSRIIVPHRPLCTYGDEIGWLRIDGFDDGSNVGIESLGAGRIDPATEWEENTAFAFFHKVA